MRAAGKLGLGVAGTLALAAAAALSWKPPDWLIDRIALLYPGCLYRVPTDEPWIALTIDDGPDPGSTPLILDQLRRHRAHATFFLIAGRVSGREGLVRELVSDGHEIGNHFTRDRPSIFLSGPAFEADLLQAHERLQGFGPIRWARPGSGWYSQAMIEVLEQRGYRCALGSVYPWDALIPSSAFAARYILRNIRPGAVVILHDGPARGRRTARVLGKVLPQLQRRGYSMMSLSELMARSGAATRSTSAWSSTK